LRKASSYSGAVDQRFINVQLAKIAQKYDIKAIVANDTHYLEPDHHKSHDVLLCIGSGQPIYSGSRLTFNVPEFHMKGAIEVASYFARLKGLWSVEFIQSLFDNTIYFAEQCEQADWVDPKYSNPSGKELPEFPVKDQPDYDEFLKWKADNNLNDLDDDVAYLRYLCQLGFKSKIHDDADRRLYNERLQEELDVIEYHGFSSYMLIVADYIKYARENGIRVGPGRGCLTGDANVLTDSGFKPLDQVQINDRVYTHDGSLGKVQNKFEYDINEIGYEIYSEFSDKPISMTSDHKVFAVKAMETEQYQRMRKNGDKSLAKVRRWEKPESPKWHPINELSINDWIYMPWPNAFRNQANYQDDFLYFLGRWVGDGWFYYHPKVGYQVGIAFHSDDITGINIIHKYFLDQDLNVKVWKSKKKKLTQLRVHNKDFQDKIRLYDYDRIINRTLH